MAGHSATTINFIVLIVALVVYGLIWYATRNGTQPVLDLGVAWMKLTGLPFVFAAWAVQRGVQAKPLAEMLSAAKADGLAHIEQIVQDSTEATPEFRRDYLTKHVCFDLGDAEKQGLQKFQQYVRDLGLVEQAHDLRYVG